MKDEFDIEKLANEMRLEKKNVMKGYDALVLKKFAMFLIPFLLLAVSQYAMECPRCNENFETETFPMGVSANTWGVTWYCDYCKQHVWSERADWKGDYYCPMGHRATNPRPAR